MRNIARSSSGGNEKQSALLFIRFFRKKEIPLIFVGKAARSSNGRTQLSESCYLGSNPGLAAVLEI